MGDNVLDIIQAKLLHKRNQDADKLHQYSETMRMAKVNSFGWKFGITCFFGMLAYLVFLIVAVVLCSRLGREFFTNIAHPIVLSSITIAASLLVGYTGCMIMEHKYDSKARFKKLSDATDRISRFECEVVNEIRTEQISKRYDVYNKTISNYKATQDVIEKLSQNYDIREKESLSKEQLDETRNTLQVVADEQYAEMDKLVAQRVLSTRFQTLSHPLFNIAYILGMGVFPTIVMLLLYSLTLVFAPSNWLLFGTTPRLICILSILGATFVCGLIYAIRRQSMYRKVYNNIVANMHIGYKPITKRYLDESTPEAYALDFVIRDHFQTVVAAETKLQEVECRLANAS